MATFDITWFSDFHKDVYGFRPRGDVLKGYQSLKQGEFEQEVRFMFEKMELDIAEDQRKEEQALIGLKSDIALGMRTRGVNWKVALDALIEKDDENSIDFYLWKRGISFAKSNEIQTKYYA